MHKHHPDHVVGSRALHLRRQLFHILHKPSPDNPIARYVNYVLAALILANCAAVALETDAALHAHYRRFFVLTEIVSSVVFTIEYLFRLWICVEQERFSRPIRGRLGYMCRPLPALDLIVVVTFLAPVDLRFLRIFRISRLLRVLHLGDFDKSLQEIYKAIGARRSMLVVSIGMMLIAIYFSASLLYIVEHKAQPDKFASIPSTLWWSVMTLTTIGYGDIFPITPLGKVLAGTIAIFGVGIFALPSAILTAAIIDGGQVAAKSGSHGVNCPHCGRPPQHGPAADRAEL